jgi:hypothetical protein
VTDAQGRREAQAVETTLALGLGVVTFVVLAALGWAAGRVLRAVTGASLEALAPEGLIAAAVGACGVVVVVLLRARRRGL